MLAVSRRAVWRLFAAMPAVAMFVLAGTPAVAQRGGLVVSVAASVADAVEEIAGVYRAQTGAAVSVNTGGSNSLARQIVEGAPVALFLSADEAQMNAVEKAGRLVAGTRSVLLTNELAIVSPTSSAVTVGHVLEGRVKRLAMGDPMAVPAGVYGRTWLEHQGAWSRVSASVVPFPTVRAVVAAVASGRADAGIVYATDAIGANVRVVSRVAAKEHDYLRIEYPIALIKGASEGEAGRFLEFMKGPQARTIFSRRGFGTPP